MFTDIMLDLETLDTKTSAVVLSIGAVAFDPNSDEIGEKLYLELTNDTAKQQELGRTISGETVSWWMQQGAAAKTVFSDPPQPGVERVSTMRALSAFEDMIERHGGRFGVELWGNGADFDNLILGSLYRAFQMKTPWSYSRNRCFRTMKSLPGVPKKPDRVGVHHNALDDALTQAEHLQRIYASYSSR